jgi:hypothetical protein
MNDYSSLADRHAHCAIAVQFNDRSAVESMGLLINVWPPPKLGNKKMHVLVEFSKPLIPRLRNQKLCQLLSHLGWMKDWVCFLPANDVDPCGAWFETDNEAEFKTQLDAVKKEQEDYDDIDYSERNCRYIGDDIAFTKLITIDSSGCATLWKMGKKTLSGRREWESVDADQEHILK